MKNLKIYLFITFLLIVSIANAQSIIWEEDFETNPGTWNLDQNWSITNDMLQLYWSPTISPYDLSATSPSISLPDNVGDLQALQYISEYSTNQGEYCEINILHDQTSTTIWSYELNGQNWGNSGGTEFTYSLYDFAGMEVQIEFRSYGTSTYNFNSWDIYNVAITAALDHDLAAMDISGPSSCNVGDETDWSVTVKNTGMNPESDYTVKLMKEGEVELASQTVSASLVPDEEYTQDFTWIPSGDEATYLYGKVEMSGDEFTGNNETGYHNINIYPENAPLILVWDNDNNSGVSNPDLPGETPCEQFIQLALDENNAMYETTPSLPSDLSTYDAIFITLGIFCVG